MDRKEYRKNFGQRLRFARQRRGMTQAVLAEEVGITAGVLSHYENGKSEPMISIAIRLSEVLKIPLLELIQQKPEFSVSAEGERY